VKHKAKLHEDYEIHQKQLHRTLAEKAEEMKAYAEKWKLKFNGKVLHAFREHDQNGAGSFNKTLTYTPGKYYRDWHCDLLADNEDSFGLGIFPSGDTPVTVTVEDWGVAVADDAKGKARVWGITIGKGILKKGDKWKH